jgi:WYL_2, Sm-like SH3 beta-barrel fold
MAHLTKIRSYVMTVAQHLKKSGLSFSQSLKKAWKLAKMAFNLIDPNFEFVKVETGEIRAAIGTSFSWYVSKTNEVIVRYFDMEKQSNRSFRLTNLI